MLEVVNSEKPARFLVITLWKHQMKFFACWVKLRPQKMYGIYLQSQTVFHPSWAVLGLPRCLIEAPSVPMRSFSFELTVSDGGSKLRKRKEKLPKHGDSIKAFRQDRAQRLWDDRCLSSIEVHSVNMYSLIPSQSPWPPFQS